jgi:hypothetical protein
VKVPLTRPCFVCGRAQGSPRALPSGAVVDLCFDCSVDRWRLAEAERRVTQATKEILDG